MKILSFTSSYPLPGSLVGPFIENLNQRLVEQGHKVRVIVYSVSGKYKVSIRKGVEVIEYPYSFFLPPKLHEGKGLINSMKLSFLAKVEFPLYLLATIFYLLKFSRDCDVIHAQFYLPAGFLAVLTKFWHRKPVVITALGKEFHLPNKWIFRKILNFTNEQVDQGVAVSKYLRNQAANYGLDISKIIVINNCIPFEEFQLPRKREHGHELVIGYACRLVPEKRTKDVLRAFSRLMQNPPAPNLALWIVGGGEEFDELVKMAKDLGISDKTKFFGFLPPDEMPRIFSEMDIFLNPTQEEGLAHTNLEAMAAGAVVVCSEGVGNDEVVTDGVTGRTFPIGDLTAMVERLREIIGDPEKRQAIAQAGREHVRKNFHVNSQLARYIEVYQKLLAQS